MDLIIVESPTKAKTISKFLPGSYKVESSFGHVRDLPVSKMGVDIEHDFIPQYVVPAKSRQTITRLKDLAKKADVVILASDEDREGEAIAWHLKEALGLKTKTANRIVFHEITKTAILEALKHPRNIDQKLVDAQQARRILDRLVGYELSPFLWKKVARGLSAGRVQSVAVRLVVEREREIQKFVAEEYWTLSVDLENKQALKFRADLYKKDNKVLDKFYIQNQESALALSAQLKEVDYEVLSVIHKKSKRQAGAPFTTSSLQQAANRLLGFSAKETMMLAQRLYESGFITYMRTDSVNLADKFIGETQDYLQKKFGQEYTVSGGRQFKTKNKNAQEAHEAIRPTDVFSDFEAVQSKLDPKQARLYKLIWQRAVASQMPEALFDLSTVDVKAGATGFVFRASGQVLRFLGYLKIYPEKFSDQELPELHKGDALKFLKLIEGQHFTKAPARYSDAGLVKELEKHSIGRPSTYAPTIATIIDRGYVRRDEAKRLEPEKIAFVVIDLLVEHFPNIVDYEFTAKMEKNLDDIAEGSKDWQPVISEFYGPFHDNLTKKDLEINKSNIMPEKKSEEKCPDCGSPMVYKTGRYGEFLACSNYPKCKYIKKEPRRAVEGAAPDEAVEKLKIKFQGIKCEKCGADMIIRTGRFGPFLSCSAYPKCKNIKSVVDDENAVDCPLCHKGKIVKKMSRRGVFYACNNYPECKNAYWAKPTGDACPECGALIVQDKNGAKCSNRDCGYKA